MDSVDSTAAVLRRELAIEQRHVDLVYRHLGKAAKSARRAARQGQSLFRSDRETWVRDDDGTALFERDAFTFQATRRLAIIDAEHEGLVFGRLDHTDGEIRYIGRIGVRDDDYEPLVIDWRARAAEPFYRATATDPMEVVRRRVLRCRNDIVVGIEDDLLDTSRSTDDLVIVGEGALMAALKRARGHQMRDIVATIQAEQDQAIRADHRGVTVISGGPGTGKTVVALHRAAYLLYSNRRRYERGGILVVGPSALFMNYIERVLPSLGEDSVTLRSLGAVASDVLGLRAERIDSPAAAQIKGSLRMVPVLKRLVNLPMSDPPSAQPGLTVTVKGEVLSLTGAQVTRIRTDVLTRTRANNGRAAAENAIMAALYRRLPSELELSLEEMTDFVSDSTGYREFLAGWWPDLTPAEVLRRLGSLPVVNLVGEGLLEGSEQLALAASFNGPDWSVADAALLDELAAILGPIPEQHEDPLLFLTNTGEYAEVVTTADRLATRREFDPHADQHETYAHILVDEAQDLSPMQWRMVRRRGPQASWTIVGDPAQSSWPDLEEVETSLTDLIGSAPSRRFRLSTNYRSPAEVFDLAAKVVRQDYPQADLPNAVRSTGVQPELLTTAVEGLPQTVTDTVSTLLNQVEGTIGVIVPPSRLGELMAASLFPNDTERVSILTPLTAKGLEYDAVVVIDPDRVVAESPGGTRVLYVCLTRPTQRLVTIDVGEGPGRWQSAF